MEKANFIFFCIGALSLAFGIIAKPYVDTLVMRLKRLFTRKERTIEDNNLEVIVNQINDLQTQVDNICLLYTSPSPRDGLLSRMPSSA